MDLRSALKLNNPLRLPVGIDVIFFHRYIFDVSDIIHRLPKLLEEADGTFDCLLTIFNVHSFRSIPRS